MAILKLPLKLRNLLYKRNGSDKYIYDSLNIYHL